MGFIELILHTWFSDIIILVTIYFIEHFLIRITSTKFVILKLMENVFEIK